MGNLNVLFYVLLSAIERWRKTSLLLAPVLIGGLAAGIVAFGLGDGEIHDDARSGDLARVKALLTKQPGLVNAEDEEGGTPLHWACLGGKKEMAGLLLALGANVNARDRYGAAPLHFAARSGEDELANLLLGKGADPQARMFNGMTVLHLAVQGRQPKIAELLLSRKLNVNVQDSQGNTPLLLAVLAGSEPMVRFLAEKGANINVTNKRGTTPLSAAKRENIGEIIQYLKDRGAKDTALPLPGMQGAYFGLPAPEADPKMFAPGIVSTEKDQVNAVCSPDGSEFYFSESELGQLSRIMFMRQAAGGWTMPAIAPFSGKYNDVDMFMSFNGNQLYFCSDRPAPDRDENRRDSDIYVIVRNAGGWGEARNLGNNINSALDDYYPTLALSGMLYFSSTREGGTNDLYCVDPKSGVRPHSLGPTVNSASSDFDPFIASDESYLIFSSDRPGGFGGADLYISLRQADGSWSCPQNMGKRINTPAEEFAPMISADKKYLFFTSSKAGVRDIYWVLADVIQNFNPKKQRRQS